MARRDITGAVDFSYLEQFTQGDSGFVEEVLELFREQAEIWRQMLDPSNDNWRDAVHALKGSAGNIGATALHHAAGELETLAKAGWPADAGERLAGLQALWAATLPLLADWG